MGILAEYVYNSFRPTAVSETQATFGRGLEILSKRHLIILLTLLLLAACANESDNTPTSAATAVAVEPTATATPMPTRQPTATPEPTPVVPLVAVADQTIADDGEITIARVISTEPGWVVLYVPTNNGLGEIVGYTAVQPGLNENLTVTVDPLKTPPDLVALLHVDAGAAGTFEYPDGPDVPLAWEGARIAMPFTLAFDVEKPTITTADQAVAEDGMVHIDSVLASEPGWLVLQADDHGELGTVLGSTPLAAGLNENLQIHIPWRQGTPTLYAVIYEDNGRSQRLDIPGEDVPLQVEGAPIVDAFIVTYPPDIYVLDQPIVNNTFVVDRVISNGPGWLVVYYDDDGQPGLIIGSAPLADGLNERVEVEVLGSAVTPVLHLRLHEDTEPGDDFDFPRVDQPILYQDRLPETVTFRTDSGNYLIATDQPLTETEDGGTAVIIPYAITEEAAWLAVHDQNDDGEDVILGAVPLELGINYDVVVPLNVAPDEVTDSLTATMHLDGGEVGQFEYPDGPDVPLQRNRRVVQVSFLIQRETTAEAGE